MSLRPTLHQNSPNPFNPTTSIRFRVHATCDVTLSVHTTDGRLIERMIDGQYPPGTYEVPFECDGLPSGMYFCVLRAGPFSDVMKMVLLK